jgi:hypothetical protein
MPVDICRLIDTVQTWDCNHPSTKRSLTNNSMILFKAILSRIDLNKGIDGREKV